MQIYVKRHIEKPRIQTRETIGATLKAFNVGFFHMFSVQCGNNGVCCRFLTVVVLITRVCGAKFFAPRGIFTVDFVLPFVFRPF